MILTEFPTRVFVTLQNAKVDFEDVDNKENMGEQIYIRIKSSPKDSTIG